jgi:hypothetical protein
VWFYRKSDESVFIHKNNGVERQNKDFKYSFLSTHRDKTLMGMLTSLVEEFLPDKYRRYGTFESTI